MKHKDKIISMFVLLVVAVITIGNYGSLVSRSAVRFDGIFLDGAVPLLANGYANDWFPFITAGAFAIGWLSMLVTLTAKSVYANNVEVIKRAALLVVIYGLASIWLLQTIFDLEFNSPLRVFLEGILFSFLNGAILGSPSNFLVRAYLK